jgi:hypothetical protein
MHGGIIDSGDIHAFGENALPTPASRSGIFAS